MAKFVLEIGTEEIPARFLIPEGQAISSLFSEALTEAGITWGAIKTLSTPRRLAIIIDDIAEYTSRREEVISGPPVAIAYDENGEPTKALLGFMAGQNVSLEEIIRLHTEKGEYAGARKQTGGEAVPAVLAGMLPDIIGRLPFPKRMRWGSSKFTYARPIRWILALFDGEIIDFKIGPIQSGRETHGHRVEGKGPFVVAHARDYEPILEEKCRIVADGIARKKIIKNIASNLAGEVRGKILWRDALLDEVAGLVETPVPLLGSFDPSFLEVPKEALLCSMEEHQKSFGLVSEDGELLPYFLTVLNIHPADMETVRKGWERVLRARLEDARFFWKTDRADTFANWLDKLAHVVFIGPLGSMREKAERLEKLCAWLANRLMPQNAALAARAGLLAKADLVSSMVGEFDSLQGIMGGIYAAHVGESVQVAQALKEQYLPAGPDSPVPSTALGSILSIADRADTLAGCFGLDKAPTGAADPNGLRRAILGIIRILIHNNWSLDVRKLFREALKLYGERKWKLEAGDALRKLDEFFRGRLRHYFLAAGYETNMVDAILGSDAYNPFDAKSRLDALAAFSGNDNFRDSIQLLKRIENICKKAQEPSSEYRSELLKEEAEKELADTLEKLTPAIDSAMAYNRYENALSQILELKEPVEQFFNKIMVMCEEEDLRMNRLRLLNAIAARFAPLAQFSCLKM